jgi:hypothetical protein
MRDISHSETKAAEKIKHTFNVEYFFSENHAVFELMWKNMVQPSRPQMTI